MIEVIDCTEELCDFITKDASEIGRHVYKCHKGTAAYENAVARRSNAHVVAIFSERYNEEAAGLCNCLWDARCSCECKL